MSLCRPFPKETTTKQRRLNTYTWITLDEPRGLSALTFLHTMSDISLGVN